MSFQGLGAVQYAPQITAQAPPNSMLEEGARSFSGASISWAAWNPPGQSIHKMPRDAGQRAKPVSD
jgi:hypothetical protein